MIGRQIVLILVATLGLVATVLSTGLLPFNSTARALPTAGTDILNVSGSTSIISILGAETIALTGTVTIERSDPRIEGGVEVVDAEIIAMDLTGTSVTGPITVVESATLVSSGEIRSLQPLPDEFPASSFFDSFITVAVPGSPSDPLILHNEEPFHLVPTSGGSEVPLNAWPPTGVTYQDEPQPCVPLLPVLPAQVCVTSLSMVLGELKPTPTNTPTPSNTPTPTVTPTPCPTGKVPADGGCGTPTATPTHTLTPIPTVTPTPCPTGKVPADGGCGTPTTTPTPMPTPIPPPNDDFADSELVAALPSTDHEDTTSATLEPGEPRPCAGINRTVWYSFTPSTGVTLVADTVGSNYDTALAVYTGTSLGTLSTVACDDDGGPGLLSSVQFAATAGVTYYFQVGGFFGSSGHLDFNLAPGAPIATPTVTPTLMSTPIPPPNDDFADSELVAALPSTDHEDTTSATLEPGEPRPCAGINRTVWYSFTPSTGVTLVADTVGSNYDTALAVYTGTSLGTLSTVACDDDGGPGLLSSVQFAATAGVTYYFQVGGFFGSSGHLDFNLASVGPIPTFTPTPTPKDPDGDTDGDTIPNSLDDDDDGDGCTDVQELGLSATQGGRRNPHNFWDFFDVPTGLSFERDKAITAGDIGAIVARFGTSREPPPTKAEAFAEALATPADMTSYHAAYDRAGSDPQGDVWDLLPPDGSITAGDIGAVVAQFGHTCVTVP